MTAYLTDRLPRYVTGGDSAAHFAMMIEVLDGKKRSSTARTS